ncbi:MAG: type II toxin-antitoxin system RelE/ParE family toxin [Phycisphaerales bacterium]
MRRYRVEIKRSAAKELEALDARARGLVAAAIDGLAEDPLPAGCQPIKGAAGCYRIRVGDYRVVYELQSDVLVVLVIRIGHRRDVYRDR